MTRLLIVAAASIGLILFVAFFAARLLQSRRQGISIRMQIFVALAAIVGAFAFGLGLLVIDRIESRAARVATEAATDEARLAARLIGDEMERHDLSLSDVARHFETQRRSGEEFPFELYDRAGTLLYPEHPLPLPPGLQPVSVEAVITPRGESVGTVRVVQETLEIRRLLADFAPTVLVISLVLGAAAALAAAWIGRAIAVPIEELSAFSERVANGLGDIAPPPRATGREVLRLTHSIDSMRRQLQGRPFVEAFAADLSHELKNPVAAIRASAEVLNEGALEEPALARHFVGRIGESVERIERLLSDLLSLAQIEARGVEGLGKLEMGQLARAAIDLTTSPSRITLRCDQVVHVRGDRTWLLRALSNLLDNALVHSAEDHRVDVTIALEGDYVMTRVSNAGEVAKHVRKNIFRRFATTRQGKGGSGLGLAIVRAVAEAHGGQAELVRSGPPEVEFGLRLPALGRPYARSESAATTPLAVQRKTPV